MAKMRAVQVSRPNGPLEIVERSIPEPGAGSVRIKVESAIAIPLQRTESFPELSTRASRVTRSPESSTPSERASRRGGHAACESVSAGTVRTAGIAMPAAGATSSPAR